MDENERRMLPNKEFHSLYRSSNKVRVITTKTLSWAGHIPRMEEGSSAFKILTGNYRKKTFSKDYAWMERQC
jgi:hypothetical protein